MFNNPKRAFVEALLLAGVVFIIGLMIGVSFESSRLADINEYYSHSELSLMDSLALNRLSDLDEVKCSSLITYDFSFADRIYEEALILERYEDAGKISEEMKITHKRYDLLRTLLWINVMKTRERCSENFSSVVYLYNYDTEDLTERAQQIVWSRVLFDLKQEKGSRIILIPISANSNLASLNLIIEKFEINKYPAVIVNEKDVLYEVSSVEDLKKYL